MKLNQNAFGFMTIYVFELDCITILCLYECLLCILCDKVISHREPLQKCHQTVVVICNFWTLYYQKSSYHCTRCHVEEKKNNNKGGGPKRLQLLFFHLPSIITQKCLIPILFIQSLVQIKDTNLKTYQYSLQRHSMFLLNL